MFKTTEITAYTIPSDNVLNNRLFFAYKKAANLVKGEMLEVGCGSGKGLTVFPEVCDSYTAIDKNDKLIQHLSGRYPHFKFINQHIPPFVGLADNSFDSVVTLQVIEHIEDDHSFVKEIHRVLKTGGKAIISTPNRNLSLSRNPWHVREYTAQELTDLLKKYFTKVEIMGIKGSKKVMEYHDKNRKSIEKITRFDIFNLQQRLPRALLQMPYDILNRMNRNKLMNQDNELVMDITIEDFSLSNQVEECLDFFYIVEK